MKKNYDPAIKDFMKRSSKLMRKAARSNDPALMWAVLHNLQSVLDGYEMAAYKIIHPKKSKK